MIEKRSHNRGHAKSGTASSAAEDIDRIPRPVNSHGTPLACALPQPRGRPTGLLTASLRDCRTLKGSNALLQSLDVFTDFVFTHFTVHSVLQQIRLRMQAAWGPVDCEASQHLRSR